MWTMWNIKKLKEKNSLEWLSGRETVDNFLIATTNGEMVETLVRLN